MIRNQWFIALMAAGFLAAMAIAAETAGATDNVPRMTKEELKAKLDNPDLIILDVRQGRDWDASEFKIKGAQRKESGKINDWKEQLTKDKTIVVYCA